MRAAAATVDLDDRVVGGDVSVAIARLVCRLDRRVSALSSRWVAVAGGDGADHDHVQMKIVGVCEFVRVLLFLGDDLHPHRTSEDMD